MYEEQHDREGDDGVNEDHVNWLRSHHIRYARRLIRYVCRISEIEGENASDTKVRACPKMTIAEFKLGTRLRHVFGTSASTEDLTQQESRVLSILHSSNAIECDFAMRAKHTEKPPDISS